MFTEAGTIESGSCLQSEVCIVGAGAAGITLALQLAGSAHRVLVLESGGFELEAATQALYEGSIAGVPGPALTASRLRYFGGSTNHWGGVIAPLDPIDFEKRAWIPHSGWPIAAESLRPFYERAQAMCDSGPFDYDAAHWMPGTTGLLPFAPARLCARLWQHSAPARFGRKYRSALGAAGNIDVVLHANATELEMTQDGKRLRSIKVATLNGNGFEVQARFFVLACGGVENPRLLLASDAQVPAGVANGRGVVGRYYSGHPRVDVLAEAFWFPAGSGSWRYQAFSSPRSPYPAAALVGINAATQKREKLLNTAFRLSIPGGTSDLDDEAPCPVREEDETQDFDSALRAVTAEILDAGGRVAQTICVRSRSETVPNPESRVLLDEPRDALGMRRAKVDWRMTDQDRRSLARCTRILAEEFGRAGIGRMRLPDWFDRGLEYQPPSFFGSWHHMGTTRMGNDPSTSVVNAEGRAHELENLYLAGSSVFPTFGWGTPTLTIVALALRLAEHLKIMLAR